MILIKILEMILRGEKTYSWKSISINTSNSLFSNTIQTSYSKKKSTNPNIWGGKGGLGVVADCGSLLLLLASQLTFLFANSLKRGEAPGFSIFFTFRLVHDLFASLTLKVQT